MPSTVIAAIHYDEGILKIVLVSGTVYHYLDVPEEVYTAMKTSKSKGIYFNQHIKDRYHFEKIH